MLGQKTCIAVVAGVALLGMSISAQAGVVYDFEGESTGTGLSSLSMTESGITLTLSRESGDKFGVSDQSGIFDFPASWGDRTLDPFEDTAATWLVGDFSEGVSNVRIQMGDFAPSDSDTLQLEAWSGLGATGTLLGSDSVALSAPTSGPATFTFDSVFVAAASIRSIRFIGGSSSFPNSLFYDNITVNAVPLPPAALLGLGLLGGLGLMRRRRRRQSA